MATSSAALAPRLYTMNQVAILLNCHRDTVLRRIRTGRMRFVQDGPNARIYVPVDEVERLLKARFQKKTA